MHGTQICDHVRCCGYYKYVRVFLKSASDLKCFKGIVNSFSCDSQKICLTLTVLGKNFPGKKPPRL